MDRGESAMLLYVEEERGEEWEGEWVVLYCTETLLLRVSVLGRKLNTRTRS